MGRVKDKITIITGGASGPGRAGALLLGEEGANFVVTDIGAIKGKKVVEEIRGYLFGF